MREVRLHVEWPVRIDRRPRQRAVTALTPSPPAPVAHATVLITPPISSLALGGVEGRLEGLSVTFEEIEFGACLHVFHVEPLDVALRGGAHRGSWMSHGAEAHAEAAGCHTARRRTQRQLDVTRRGHARRGGRTHTRMVHTENKCIQGKPLEPAAHWKHARAQPCAASRPAGAVQMGTAEHVQPHSREG